MPNLARRVHESEWMDTVAYPVPVVKETLNFLRFTNRRFGGTTVVLSYLKEWSVRWKKDETIEVLDVGTGAADIPIAIVRWARQLGFKVRVTGIDLNAEIVEIAREHAREYPEMTIRQENFSDLLKKQGSFDYVVASLFLHHTPPEDTLLTVKAFHRLSRKGFIISDLLRSYPGYWSVKLLSFLAGNTVVRHDGPLSVRRAFHPEELKALILESGLPYLKVRRHPWFRVSLAGEKNYAT